jgi:CopG family nickel-responsive transcriptional regulator
MSIGALFPTFEWPSGSLDDRTAHLYPTVMSKELVRFGIAIEEELLRDFDAQVARKGYENRSEAIRDLIRAGLVEETVLHGGPVTGALMIVYRHHVRELTERLTAIQHELGESVISALHVHLDHDHCLEVVVMRGEATLLKRAADQILATRGVVHGKLSLTATPQGPEQHGPGFHGHDGQGKHRHGKVPRAKAHPRAEARGTDDAVSPPKRAPLQKPGGIRKTRTTRRP